MDVMTLENGEEIQLPKPVAQSNTLSMFMKRPTTTPANTPIRVPQDPLTGSSPIRTPQESLDEDKDCTEETKECNDADYYDGCNEDSSAGMLIISC